MSAPITLRSLDGLALRAACGCGHEAAVDATRIEMMMGDLQIGALRRGLRCGGCRKRSRPMLIAAMPPPRPAPNIFAFADVRKPQKRLDFIALAFAIADQENRERFEAIHGKPFELAAEERENALLIRAMIGWAND